MRCLPALLSLALLAGCASLSEDACRSEDWYAIGARDGSEGRDYSYVERHFKACNDYGIRPDVRRWEAGRRAGLPLYCTPSNAFSIASRGGSLNPVCPPADMPLLRDAEFLGDQVFEVDIQIRDANDDLREARDIYLDETIDDPVRSRAFLREARARSEIRRLERERRRLVREARALGYGL